MAAALELLARSRLAVAIVAVESRRFVFVNDAFASLTDQRSGDGAPVELAPLLARGRRGPHTELTTARRADGTRYRVAISVAPLSSRSDADGPTLCVLVQRDLGDEEIARR